MAAAMGTAARVLLVEDDEALVEALRYALSRQGYHVWYALDGRRGLQLAQAVQPDLIVLDLMLPQLHGLDLCRLLRSVSSAAILILTARDDEETVVAGFAAGADDYVVKPFRLRELLARVEALLRRSQGDETAETITIGRLVVHRREQRATYDGVELPLAPRTFAVLAALAMSPGKLCSRATLLDRIWGSGQVVDPRNIDVHIRRIRAALQRVDPAAAQMIQTVHGAGYRLQPLALERIGEELNGEVKPCPMLESSACMMRE
jgi:DNA-binding response OmpR family regulator